MWVGIDEMRFINQWVKYMEVLYAILLVLCVLKNLLLWEILKKGKNPR